MTQSLALALFAGTTLALAWLALPHNGSADEFAVAVTCFVMCACGVLLLALPSRYVSPWLLNAAVALVTVLISLASYFSHTLFSGFALFYVWVIPYAYFFFTLRQAALHTMWAGICFAAALGAMRSNGDAGLHWDSTDLTRWVIVIGTVLIVGSLVRRLATWMRESEARFRQGFDEAALGMALVTPDLHFMDVNEAYAQILGRRPDELLQLSYYDVTHPDDHDIVESERQLAQSDDPRPQQIIEKRVVRPDSSIRWVSCHAALVRGPRGAPLHIFSQLEDITERRRTEQALARQAAQQAAVAHLGEVALREGDLGELFSEVVRTVTTTMGAELCFAAILSDGGEELVAHYGGPNGLAGPEAFTRTPRSLTDFTMSSDVPVLIRDLRRETRFTPPEPLLARGAVSGLTVPIGTREEPLGMLGAFTTRQRSFSVDETHFLHAVANVLADAIKHRRAEEAHRHAAVHDALTGLPNRTLALDRIDHALHGIEREDLTVAVIVLDLDRFKVINDSLGHAAGDRLLLAIAPRLLDAVRPSDTVARLGGDEFVIVCEHLAGAREAIVLAERIEAAVARPLTLDSGEHHVSASIGIAVATDGHETPQSMLRDADAAMYRAKAGGRGRVELFDDRMREQVLGRLRMETELRRAIDRGDLRVHYQPIVDLESRRPVSVEALVRWERPNGRLMPPDMFIPVAEETGLIFDVGLWVLREACRQVSAWQRAYDDPLGLGVNASGRQIHDPVFPQEVSGIARHYELAPGTLGLEVTESVLIEDAESPVTVLARLREDGLRISLDDFGTGYSSLSYLKRLPLDALKVDRSFVKGLDSSPDDSAIIEAVIKLAQTLGLDVVAEGVETDQQAELLRRLSCRKAQGFLFTPPLPADEFRHYLDAHYASYTP